MNSFNVWDLKSFIFPKLEIIRVKNNVTKSIFFFIVFIYFILFLKKFFFTIIEERHCYWRIDEKSEKSRETIKSRIRPETFGFVDKCPKRSAIEDIPRCLYDIQFLSLFYCYSECNFPITCNFWIESRFFLQYPFFIRDKLINNFLSRNSFCLIQKRSLEKIPQVYNESIFVQSSSNSFLFLIFQIISYRSNSKTKISIRDGQIRSININSVTLLAKTWSISIDKRIVLGP